MKALAVILSLTILPGLAVAQGEKLDPSKLPPRVADAVKLRFPGATITQVTKEIENGETVFDIEMTRAGKKHEMDCKEDGTLIDLQNEVPASELPAGAADAIKKKYPGSTIKEVGEILVAKDGKETKSGAYLLAELRKIEKPSEENPAK